MSDLVLSNLEPSNLYQPATETFWADKRVIVTGGGGFLGSFVIEKLIQHGAKDILIPRMEHYDLTNRDDIRQLLDDALLPTDQVPSRLKPLTSNPSTSSGHRLQPSTD